MISDSRSKPDRAETSLGSVHESGGAVGNRTTPVGTVDEELVAVTPPISRVDEYPTEEME